MPLLLDQPPRTAPNLTPPPTPSLPPARLPAPRSIFACVASGWYGIFVGAGMLGAAEGLVLLSLLPLALAVTALLTAWIAHLAHMDSDPD